jgi:hypothetical protein
MKNIVRAFFPIFVLSAVGCTEPTDTQEDLGSDEQAASVVVWHQTWNGGQATGYVSGPFSFFTYAAWENKTATSRTAYLSFFGSGVDPTSEVCTTEEVCYPDRLTGEPICEPIRWCDYTRYYWEDGWGEIPSQDFKVGQNLRAAHLQTDLANNPNFYGNKCTFDSLNATTECVPITTGTFDVTWRTNGYYANKSQGTSSESYQWYDSSYTSRSTGTWTSVSANTTGTVFGNSVDGWGDLAQSRGTNVSKDIVKD